MKDIKKIAVLTSGGDAPGMNSAVRAVVFSAAHSNIEVTGILRGYDGLIDWETRPLSLDDVRNIINQGGTILYTARSERFLKKEFREIAAANLRDHGIDALVSVLGYIRRGGQPSAKDRMYGSLMGAYAIEILNRGQEYRIVAIKNDILIDYDITEAIDIHNNKLDDFQYQLSLTLSE